MSNKVGRMREDAAAPRMKRQEVTSELLDQDENVYVSKNTHQKGLQQYYTPLKVAKFMHDAMGQQNGVVCDLTAGTGNLLSAFRSTEFETLGVELDKSNIPKAESNFKIVNANLPELYPYLLKVEFQPNVLVLNPPFSLFWTCPELTGSEDKKIESQMATILMALRLVPRSGQGAFIAEKSTWDKALKLNKEIRQRTYSVVTARNMFAPYSAIECVIGFFYGEELGYDVDYQDELIIDATSHGFDNAVKVVAQTVTQARRDCGVYPSTLVHADTIEENKTRFAAAFAEYRERKKTTAKQVYSIDYAGGRLKVHLSNYTQFVLERDYGFREKQILSTIGGLSPSYFAFNTQDRKALFEMLETKTLVTMSPAAKASIEKAVIDAEFILTPMYALKPQQRLAYLEDIGQIKCVKEFVCKESGNDPVRFERGQMYDVTVSTTTTVAYYDKESGPTGAKKEMAKVGKILLIEIGGQKFTEQSEDIQVIIDHFEIPDPRDVRAKKPALYNKIRKRLESDEFKLWTFEPFQVEDLTRLAMKSSVIFSWEQGLGKSRGALAWAQVRNAKKTLIICPQDIKKQWVEEAAHLNISLQEIKGYSDLQDIKNAESGYYLIHYELLKGSRRYDEYEPEFGTKMVDEDGDEVSLSALCPKCKATRNDGWTGRSCRECGYHIWRKRKKPIYTRLKHAFDTVIVDEGVKIKSKHSQQGIAVRSLHATNRLLLSGSPIKGWITDAFWLCHWVLGNASPRFPYHYLGGTEKFLDDFGVFEYVAEEFRKSLSKGKKKLLPEIGNLHLLWKMLAPSVVRRTKAECGVTLVNKNVHRIKVGFTVEQKRVYDWWIDNFTEWFKASHQTEMDDNAVQMKEMILGLLWKLRLTATCPSSRLLPGTPAPGMEESFFPGAQSKSNYTEKAMFVLSKAKEVVDKGEQMVIFTSMQDNAHFLKALFGRFKIKCETANAETSPEKRGLLMKEFKLGRFSILIAGTQAVNFGHNLDNANHVIMTDYEWDHSTTRQAIDRVHRFTSKKDVNVYLLYTEGGIDRKQLFEIIDRKGQSSDLALDGKLMDQDELQVDFFKMAREILKEHKMGADGLLTEEAVERKMIEMFQHNLALPVGEEELAEVGAPLIVLHQSKPKKIVYINQIDLFI